MVDKPLLAYLCKGIRRHQGSHTTVRFPMTSALLATLKAQLAQANLIQARSLLSGQRSPRLLLLGVGSLPPHPSTADPTTCADKILPWQLTGPTSLSPSRHPKQTLTGCHAGCQWQQPTPSPAQSEPCGPSYDPVVTVPPSGPAIHLALGQVPHPLSPHEDHAGFAPGRRPHTNASLPVQQPQPQAATEAAAAGLPSWLIQTAGRWKSAAYKRYIRPPKKALLSVAPALAGRAGRR